MKVLGTSVLRKEAWQKVTGAALYNEDEDAKGLLHCRLVTSTCAHGYIRSIDLAEAYKVAGVLKVVTGEMFPEPTGVILFDHPALAYKKVRYYGEPVAIVVATTEQQAALAASLVKVEYVPLPAVRSAKEAVLQGAPLIHESYDGYNRVSSEIHPEIGTNIAHRWKIRKGDMHRGWAESEAVVEAEFFIPHADHSAMETRSARAGIAHDGTLSVSASTQAPHSVRKHLATNFGLDSGKVMVKAPFLGGAFGGKAGPMLEPLAYMASASVGGKRVRMANPREQDIMSMPVRIGLEARVKIGAKRDGKITAMETTFLWDCGAYSDISPHMAKSAAADCTGPYSVQNLWCDSLVVYTNNTYATSFRGFSHSGVTFCVERTMDKLAYSLGIDPLELRLLNAAKPGDTSPTQTVFTQSNLGDPGGCMQKLREMLDWDSGSRVVMPDKKVRSKGIGCFWKAPDSSTDASSSAILMFNPDGSLNLITGVVEFGTAAKTNLASIAAERLKMPADKVHVLFPVDTGQNPRHWKTVASMSTYMTGNAVVRAADDAIRQLKRNASMALRCAHEDLDVADQRVFVRADPAMYIEFKDIAFGYKHPDGSTVGKRVIGHGSFVMSHLTNLDPATGKGDMSPTWTVGAQGVEIEYDPTEHSYTLLRAITAIDAGKSHNPKGGECVVMGGMNMGLSCASREALTLGDRAQIQETSFRTYKIMRYGETPRYEVAFLQTPQIDGPYDARGFGEHGIIGMQAALANALSRAAEVEINTIPITPETIFSLKRGVSDDPH